MSTVMIEPWRTEICTSDENGIWVRGYDIASLMEKASFADMLFLLHRGRLPEATERRLLDAILVSVADHGPGAPSCAAARLVASGNRQSLSAAIAAGVLAIGDEHGGAGSACMEMIARGAARVAAGIHFDPERRRSVGRRSAGQPYAIAWFRAPGSQPRSSDGCAVPDRAGRRAGR